jgi:hypothetical protein
MPKVKLTLSVEQEFADNIKQYAERKKTTVSNLFERAYPLLTKNSGTLMDLPKRIEKMLGTDRYEKMQKDLSGVDAKQTFHKTIEKKHGGKRSH